MPRALLHHPFRVLVTLFLTIFSVAAAQSVVPSATYVSRGDSSDNNDNITVSINVPSNSSSDLYFHFSAPAGQSWAAFGIGRRMAGTLMFVVYDAGNENVTVSPRLGTGHVMPQHTDDVEVELLSGSGIHDGVYVVNARCSNCRSWSGGSADVGSTSQGMIWAVGPPGTLQTTDLNAGLRQHSHYDGFTLNLEAATGDAGVPSAFSDSDNTEIDEDGGRGRGGSRGVIRFHAFLMVASFLVLFPLGYLLLRVFERVMLHWITQSIAAILVCLGTGAGIAYSVRNDLGVGHPHQIIGFIVLVLMIAAWIVGFAGHRIYRKTGTPAKIMVGHRALGPATISMGLANCFVGFRFADSTRGIIGMGIATVIMVVVVVAAIFFSRRRKHRKGAMNTPAAANFREGQMEPQYTGHTGYGQGGIPLDNYDQPPPVYR